MAQHDYVINNDTGANVRADLNNALLAIVSHNSGSSAPATPYAFELWVDTSVTPSLLRIRNAANSAWIAIGDVTQAGLGLLSLAGGTMTGQLLAAALGLVATPDVAFSGDPDTGIYRAGANLLGLVANGAELLRVDGVLGYVKFLANAGLLLPIGTTAQRPTGANGILRYNSDLNSFEGYKNGNWGALGGGGGGAGFVWRAVSSAGTAGAAVEQEENAEIVRLFGAGLAQELYATVKIPQSYSAGTPISIFVAAYSPSTSGTQLFKAQATLIRSGTDAFSSTTNQRTTTNSALTNTVASQLRVHVLDVTDASGLINGVGVSAGDVIKIRLYRDATDTDTADVRMIPNSTDIKFS